MKFFKILIYLTAALLLSYFALKIIRSMRVVAEATQFSTDHFNINYKGIYAIEAEEIGSILEANYRRIISDLGGPAHEKISVFIHASQKEFNKGTGLVNSSANGTSRGPLEFHFLWTNWFNSIFPDNPRQTALHEFAHCVQLNILIKQAIEILKYEDEESFNKAFEQQYIENYPQWFWEAISLYEAAEVNRLSVYYGMRNKPSLSSLNNGNQIYQVGYTLIEYIVATWGKDKIPTLITSYADTEEVLGVSKTAFEEGWHQYVDEQY